MVRLCYLLLCHKNPEGVSEQIDYLLASDGYVVVHIDKNAKKSFHEFLHRRFGEDERVRFVDPVRAGWGDWSLVKATLRMIRMGLKSFPEATHFYYLSGDCAPIRPHEELKDYLKSSKLDLIETSDFYTGGWIQTGPQPKRVEFYHFINERKYKKLFYFTYAVQELLGIKRKPPDGLVLSIGSQWWCLKRRTLEHILLFIGSRPRVVRFFRRCWIPDELFFQTLVATLVDPSKRKSAPPTFLRFSDYGIPMAFYNDHYNFLTSQEEFFARKISENAIQLKRRLANRFLGPKLSEPSVSSGRDVIEFFIYAGRNGFRHSSRNWQRGSHLPASAKIYVIVSKKWDVGKEFGRGLSDITQIPYLGYLFDEDGVGLDGLGGYERERGHRLENPVAFLRAICEAKELNQLIICADSIRLEELKALSVEQSGVRVIELQNEFSDEYLDGHAERSGLHVQHMQSNNMLGALHKTVRQTFEHESNVIQSLPFEQFGRIGAWQKPEMRAEILGAIFEKPAKEFTAFAKKARIVD